MIQRVFACALFAGCTFATAFTARAQVELTGTYVRYLAVGADGTMICNGGACAAHSMQYAEATTDTPSCDLYYPGSPVETFTLEATPAGSTLSTVLTNTGSSSLDDLTTTAGPTVAGRTITWSGTGTIGATTVRIDQTFELQTDDRFVRLSVVVTNTGTVGLSDVYYLRNGDPDHGSCSIGFDFATDNDVRRQPPVDDSALATARGGDATGTGRSLVLGIGAHDPRARAYNGGFENTDASGEWTFPVDGAGASADEGVDLVFREPTLAAGASTTFEMFYVWGRTEAEVETRFDELGFPTAPCVGLAEGAACTTSAGDGGLCRDGRCCTGCFDGTRCRAGGSATTCGAAGAMCASCVDGDACTSDVCAAGACANPIAPLGTSCDDGLFCTASDTCDAAGSCVGAGARCDDREDCTVDSCDESTDLCTNAGRAEGATCTASAGSGLCHSARCCTGCWNGTSCQLGTAPAACGAAGAMCASCVDPDACTSDVCTAGACSNPHAPTGTRCDDGMYCTTTDSCDGAGACLGGGGPRCNDGMSCTADSCDEGADSCVYTAVSGCTIGGSCVGEGTVNPTYPCQICDPARSTTDWSPVAVGAACGTPSCSGGRITIRTCDAAGACVASPRTPCPTGACADTQTCAAACAPEDCASGEHCDPITMQCEALREAGADCADATACLSGTCVDGVCCESVCDGTCERCDVLGLEGTCAPLDAGDDPDGECARACDGAGACESEPDAGRVEPDAGTIDGDAAVQQIDAGAGRDAGTGGTPRGGCGCSAPGSSRSIPLSLAFALVAVGVLWRRRRVTSRARRALFGA